MQRACVRKEINDELLNGGNNSQHRPGLLPERLFLIGLKCPPQQRISVHDGRATAANPTQRLRRQVRQ
jgi:hypothetical protein